MQPVDITAQGFAAWRSNQWEQQAAKTLNEYYDALAGLLRWLVRQGKLTANPLLGVRKAKTDGAERRLRRAFTDNELRRLVAVAGPRRIVYLVAAGAQPHGKWYTTVYTNPGHFGAKRGRGRRGDTRILVARTRLFQMK